MTIQAAADNFIKWLNQEEITSDINNELLLSYLNHYEMGGFAGGAFSLFPDKDRSFVTAINQFNINYGFYFIQTYEAFCQLAEELHKQGYEEIGKTKPSEDAYNLEVREAERLEKKYGWKRVGPVTRESQQTMEIPVQPMKITFSK